MFRLNHQGRMHLHAITLYPKHQRRQQTEQQTTQHDILRAPNINKMTADRSSEHTAHIGRRQEQAIGKIRRIA